MDPATIIGILLGAIVVVASISTAGAPFGAFWNLPGLIVVLGGSTAAALVATPLRSLGSITAVFRQTLFNRSPDHRAVVEEISDLAETARRDGLLALENRMDEVKQPFLHMGLQLAIDGARPEIIEDVMRSEIEAVAARHADGRKLFDQLGRYAPAFGMVGTLIGLVIMLGRMESPERIGNDMSIALLTTLYGAVAANLIFLPIADKLRRLDADELRTMEIIVRGVMGIQSGDNPRVIAQRLTTFLPPVDRYTEEEQASAA